jgi:phage terminase small subunit
MAQKLTDKLERFSQEYLLDCNKTQAAIRAGYSPKTAHAAGERAFKNVEVHRRILAGMAKRSEKTEIKAEDVLKLINDFIHTDITQVLGLSIQEIKDLPEIVRLMVTGTKVKDTEFGEEIELKFIDKGRLIDMVNRHTGIYEKDNEQLRPTVKQIFKIGNQEVEF